MPELLRQNDHRVVNLSKLGDEYVATIEVLTSCSSFSIIGKSKEGQLIALIDHAPGGDVRSNKLDEFKDAIIKHGITQLSILEITREDRLEDRKFDRSQLDNVKKWANKLLEEEIIDGYQLKAMYAMSPDSIRYGKSGIYVVHEVFLAKKIDELVDVEKGKLNEVYGLSDIQIIADQQKTATSSTPFLDKAEESSNQVKDKSNCCVIL
ncbi:MAG: hypothetical protein EP298_04130 [Gammaproteobacteria bacterium]|nr:MAG: hypothetical protein EP298_04130 [Gammaproteobacteria bacterium]UTW43818.1 hypothetical protein KFE69_06940 [bacterium SCSIO 12844]